MSDTPAKPSVPELTEYTQANVLAEAAATMAAQAAAKAAAAKAKAEEALARAAAIRAGANASPDASTTAAPAAEIKAAPVPPAAPAEQVKPVAAAPAPVAAKVSPAPAPVALPTLPQPDLRVAERRTGTERRGDEERRSLDDRRVGSPDTRPADQQIERRSPEGRRTTPNPGRRATDATDDSGIIRLGEAVRAARSAQAADRRSLARGPVRAAGSVLEPEAHRAGLGATSHKKRRGISPGLIFLFGLMIFFGMYATGHLPQFDQWTDAAVQKSRSHNDQVVGTIANNWHMFAYGAAGLCVLFIVFLIFNSVRARAHENGE